MQSSLPSFQNASIHLKSRRSLQDRFRACCGTQHHSAVRNSHAPGEQTFFIDTIPFPAICLTRPGSVVEWKRQSSKGFRTGARPSVNRCEWVPCWEAGCSFLTSIKRQADAGFPCSPTSCFTMSFFLYFLLISLQQTCNIVPQRNCPPIKLRDHRKTK